MLESLIFAFLLVMLNVVFGVKPHPIFGVVVSFITFFIGVTYFITDDSLPFNSPNPIFTIFVLIIAGTSLICQWYDYKKIR